MTIFATSGVPAPEGIDGRNLLPLLTDPSGRVRDFLPLFNFRGTDTAQSLAVVTLEWRYICWYSAKGGMKPTDELFHLGRDKYEMRNVASDPEAMHALAMMKQSYDKELAKLAEGVISGHGHEPYPKLFDPGLSWEKKATLLHKPRKGDSEEGDGKRKTTGKKTKK